MKKEAAAVVLLLLLIAGSCLNLKTLDALIYGIEDRLYLSQSEADAGNTDRAERELENAWKLWLDADGYTHIFIRHAEIDAISDAFCELLQTLPDGDAQPAYEKLLYHLESVRDIEHLSLRSVF